MAGFPVRRGSPIQPDRQPSYEGCPLCRAPREFLPERFGLLSCVGCGLVVSPDIWIPRIDEILDDAWFGEDWDPAASPWLRWFESIGNRRMYKRVQHAGNGGSLLEVGFGSGTFLAYMQARGWRVQGCDLSQSVCRRAAGRWAVPTHWGEVSSLPKDIRYDLVVMSHILEHVQDPLGMLGEIRQRMNHGGYLYVTVPNVACWEARLSGWIGYQPYHFTYFSQETLTSAFVRSGFHIEFVSTHEQFASWFQSVAGTLIPQLGGAARKETRARLRRRSRTSLIEHVYRSALVGFGVATWPFRRLQGRLGRGDEVIVLARSFS
jgi:2-polyprenyl-3-methyl-5-hydroxy-6-metoxy-1,4-benzoquinol methylase